MLWARQMCVELREEKLGLLRGLDKHMSDVSYHDDQILDKCNLREEGFILAYSLSSIVPQQGGVAARTAPAGRVWGMKLPAHILADR